MAFTGATSWTSAEFQQAAADNQGLAWDVPSETPGTETWSKCPAEKEKTESSQQEHTFNGGELKQPKSQAHLAVLVVDVLTETANNGSVNEERTHHHNGLQHLSQRDLSDMHTDSGTTLEQPESLCSHRRGNTFDQ